jgi:hypothetical protein
MRHVGELFKIVIFGLFKIVMGVTGGKNRGGGGDFGVVLRASGYV